jgi:Protein of unknown function (DUF2948)
MPSRPATPAKPLRLRAVDADDLAVIAACLQDALIPLNEMAFLAGEHRFMAAFTRFCRECLEDPDGLGCDGLMQRQSVLTLEQVEAVRFRGLDPRLGRVRLELLTIVAEPEEGEGACRVTLLFAGDVAIQIQARRLSAKLEDFGDPWPARCAPAHELEPATARGA